MYIETIPNRNSRPTILLREGRREGAKVRKTTLLNLTDWPPEHVQALRQILSGQTLAPFEEVFSIRRSLPHGHVEAVLEAFARLDLERLLDSRPSRQRALVAALVAERLLHPASKLATTRLWHSTTLAREMGVEDAEVDELYEALDWLLERQERIENKLAARHLRAGGLVLYDVSSSHYEGRTCPLARLGYSRGGKRGLPVIVYGVMTNAQGCPVSVQVYPGSTGDPTTVPDQVDKLLKRFRLERVVLVGDRGMLTQTQIDRLKEYPQLGWISALRGNEVRQLVESGTLQMSLFDQQNLAEIVSPDYPGERLAVCYNPLLAEERRHTREALLKATQQALQKIEREVRRRTKTPINGEQIALKVGRVIGTYKMKKHIRLTIGDGTFSFARDEQSIQREAMLDGIYVIRTSEPASVMNTAEMVLHYKRLAEVERVFRTLKALDIRIRPIFHRLSDRVRAHILICLLAYYVEWHMRRALAPLLFDDEQREQCRARRDPVAAARASASARTKKQRRKTDEGFSVHSFETLMAELATRCRHWCGPRHNASAPDLIHLTQPTPLQRKALELLGTIVPSA